MGIGEVPVVRVRAHGNASEHTRIELFRPLVPLFLGVVLKNSLVQFLSGPRQRGFLAVFRRVVRRAPRVQPRLHLFLGVDVGVKQRVDCFLTRRNRNHLIPFTDIHLTFHAVLVRDPLAESVDVLPHAVELGVEQMHAVLRHPKPVFVDEIVAVAPDVVAFIDDQRPQAQLPRTALREHAPGDARADDDHVVVRLQIGEAGEPRGVVVVAPAHGQVHAGPLVSAEGSHAGVVRTRDRERFSAPRA